MRSLRWYIFRWWKWFNAFAILVSTNRRHFAELLNLHFIALEIFKPLLNNWQSGGEWKFTFSKTTAVWLCRDNLCGLGGSRLMCAEQPKIWRSVFTNTRFNMQTGSDTVSTGRKEHFVVHLLFSESTSINNESNYNMSTFKSKPLIMFASVANGAFRSMLE